MFSRRDFVKGGVALVSIGTGANSLLKGAVAFAAQNPQYVAANGSKKTLILVQMAGGNDGLNTVAPVSNGTYRSLRKTIGVKEAEGLPLTNGFALHPNLTGLKGLWDGGKLGIVQGVGYPEQNYSHFKSMAIWQAGDPKQALADGWLGRSLEKLESETHDPFLGFNIGSSTPPEMRGTVPVPSVQNPADYNFKLAGQVAPVNDPRTATLMKLYEQYPAQSPYGALLETTVDSAVSSAKQLAEASTVYKPAVAYPQTSFGSGLSLLSEAVVANLGMRVGHITLGGFDTHNNEPTEHAELMQTLDQGLTAFYQDLEAQGKADDVLVLTWSEFGRRVEQNGNDGTDHGSASVCFALGKQVQGGLYGEIPNLDKLIDKGNLQYTVDFRSVYATIIERWLGIPSEPLLGAKWDQIGFLAA